MTKKDQNTTNQLLLFIYRIAITFTRSLKKRVVMIHHFKLHYHDYLKLEQPYLDLCLYSFHSYTLFSKFNLQKMSQKGVPNKKYSTSNRMSALTSQNLSSFHIHIVLYHLAKNPKVFNDLFPGN